jgi:gliding motility-associated-like protein
MDTVEIVPESTFYIPNAFTPNGDGENDYFTGKGIGIVNYHMQIFDRWGMMIFETYDLYQGWDGRANGGSGIAQQDTYVYKINLTDIFHQQHYYIGAVNLLK